MVKLMFFFFVLFGEEKLSARYYRIHYLKKMFDSQNYYIYVIFSSN